MQFPHLLNEEIQWYFKDQQYIFKGTFGKTIVYLLYLNKISINFSHLCQYLFGLSSILSRYQ